MENKNIIIILLIIIVILAVVVGVMFLQSANAKEPTKVRIISNNTLYEGDSLSIQLTDMNKTALSKEKVSVTVKNGNGKVVANKTVNTNSKGKVKLDLNLKKGKYTVYAAYGGNEKYAGNNTTQKLTVNEAATQTVGNKNSVDINQYPSYSPKVGNYRIVESHNELGLIETSNGEYYVITGDGIRTYEGHDSKGIIQFGHEV